MNTSDNPGLWDIQFNSWLFCEFNATVKSLFSCITHGVREGGFDLTFGTHGNFGSRFPVTIHALATNGDSAGFSCDRPRTHAIAITSDSLTAGQGFSIATCNHRLQGFSHEETRDWTHTYTQRDKLWRRTPHTTPRILQQEPVFSALYANFWGFLASELTRLYSASASCKRW